MSGAPVSSTGGAVTGCSRVSPRQLPELPVDGVAAGVHFVLRLPRASTMPRSVRMRVLPAFGVPPLSAYRIAASEEGGLVVGYGRLHEEAVDPAVRALARVVRRHL